MNQPSKGLALIAAYRAARLNQRPALRTSLQTQPIAAAPEESDAAEAPCDQTSRRPAADEGSVFASLVNLTQAPPAEPTIEPAAPAPAPEAEPEPAALLDTAFDPPLAEIGFGPGMLIRLSQLGLHTTGDLAQAEPDDLRAALGEISRLVDVEAWIASARQTTVTARKFAPAVVS